MKSIELRKKSRDELVRLLLERRLRREELMGSFSKKRVKNVRESRTVRKDIARIMTILRAR